MNEARASTRQADKGSLPTGRQALSLRDNLVATIARVEHIIDIETAALEQVQPINLVLSNHRKSHGLLELDRAMRALGCPSFDGEIVADLARLREKLKRNLAVLEMHLKAVRQVSALIARAIEDENSDGTYSTAIIRAAPHP